ncbi:hypothetical protein JD844_024653 [Phrynosoma platyrhinos]|uniref:Nesprin-1 n=1 Tax=Phrynosoma platyrhinos TaxID=52577 RepID=A0ABQ7SYA4_PHRPL|nr:hypothetical protein JD844_024653 [Phrynosoma platyrhinos]
MPVSSVLSMLSENREPDVLTQELGLEGEKPSIENQMKMKWESLYQEFSIKHKLLQNALEQQQEQPLYSRPNRLMSGVPLYKQERQTQDKPSVTSVLVGLNEAFEVSSQPGGSEKESLLFEQKLYSGVSSTSSWLDGVEEHLFVASALLPEVTETCLYNQEALAKDIKEMTEKVDKNKNLFSHMFPENAYNRDVIEDTLDCLLRRLILLETLNDLKMMFATLADNKYIALQKLAEAVECPETEQMQDMYDELIMIIGSRRSGLNQNLALKGQYEQALQDLADLIETGKEKMTVDQKMIISSKEEVLVLLDKHKEYFQGLESHMILTETLFRKRSSFAFVKETQFHVELMAQASAVLKQAHKRGVELEYILETWTHLEEDYQELIRQLESVETSIPGVGLVEESEERLADRIALYQHLKSSLTEYQPKLYQVLDDGKRLLFSVTCSELEAQLNQLGEQWLNNTSKVTKELQRLETILKHWTRYQSESTELIHWLQSAMERLEFWTQQSVTVPQELEMVRDHLNAFLEFSKEIEAKSSQKSTVLSTGNQLLRLKKVDIASLRAGLSQIDNQWTELLTQVPIVQEKLHQLQMDKLPSRHAITEVMSWILLMENIIAEDEENIKNVVGHKAIQDYLQKYKGFKIDINCKQLTVDFVNQSVLQISSQDVESKRSDKTDFAEQLGVMNRRWQVLQGLITEKEKRLKEQRRIGDQASVQNALKDCQELEEQIKAKEKEVEKVEQSGLFLIQNKKEEVCVSVLDTLQKLNHSWATLDHMVGQLKILLQSVLDQWSIYKAAYEELNSYLMEARYSLSRFHLLTGSLEAVKVQVDNFQNLQDELEKQDHLLQKFGSMTNQLLKECHPPVTETLNNTLKEMNLRWNNLLEEIAEHLHSSKGLLQLWQKYKNYYTQCSSTVQQYEDQTNELLKAATNKEITDDEVTAWIHDCNDLLKGMKTVQDSLFVLRELGEQLKQQVDPSAAAAIQSGQLSLNQNLSSLEQSLGRQMSILQLFQAEMFSRQQILHSIIMDGQHLLEQGQVDDRDEFNLKLALLSNQWQGVIRRAQQRRGIIDSQIRQWQRYREMSEKLHKWLVEASCQTASELGTVPIPVQQARALLDELQLKEKVLLRQQGSYILTVEGGKQLLLCADGETEAALQTELSEIQERWKLASLRLEEQKKQLTFLLKDWEKCEKGISDSLEKLKSFKRKLSQPLPEHHDELHTEQIRCKELENAAEGWTDDLSHLNLLKETLSAYISADDISVLSERIGLLHRHWEELCHQVSLRRQQVTERLNAWALFSEKNKELCEWLTQMESKVSQNGEILIEEMIEKLKKDYQDEIAVAQENKIQLQQMGERLAKASHESKAVEIEYKLGKVNDRWQHLLDLIAARMKKLKETLVAVQQLDKNMSILRSWLAHIESELSKPIVYETCDSEEIQRKLNEQQVKQKYEIEEKKT